MVGKPHSPGPSPELGRKGLPAGVCKADSMGAKVTFRAEHVPALGRPVSLLLLVLLLLLLL